ncbi:hypothetical protein [Streptomyces collinus]|uniref:hypothetical protein n=1 Tax=Streptomyces collinus TaxID=42684 RepID=UPI00294314BD|nr:hypothetical protein [Streptomyces collinus]
MADEQYKWLTGDMAERLLRGESLEAVDSSAPDQARKLAEALGALSAEAAPATGELPGEQGALAAFRKVREEAEAERAAAAFGAAGTGGGSGTGARDRDAGLVRIGRPTRSGTRSRRPGWARPVRFALAAAVAAGTLGGVAMAAGGGVLPNPFRDEHPGPVSSVSTAQSSGRPTATSSPRPPLNIAPGTPDGSSAPSLGGSPSGTAAGPGRDAAEQVTPGPGDPSGTWWREAAAACRDLRDGKELGNDRRRALENLAGGPVRVTRYCRGVLAEQNGSAGAGKGQGGDTGKGDGKGDGNGKGDGKGGGNGDGNGQGDDDAHPGRGHDRDQGGHGGRHRGGVVSPAPSAFAPVTPGRRPDTPAPSPSPSYSALRPSEL